jgi:O-antigen ligase
VALTMNDKSHHSDRNRPVIRPRNERLAFIDRRGGAAAGSIAGAPLPAKRVPTFATAAFAEPRDWGYVGLFAFTAVLLLRPQDQVPALAPLHLAEVCALIGIGPMLLHRIAYRLPAFKINAETIALFLFGLVMLVGVPLSIWPNGALTEFTESYLKIVIVFLLMMNTLTSPTRLDRLVWLILLSVGVIAARSIMNYAQGINLVEGGRLAGPIGGIFGNPNDLALNMVTFLPGAAVVALSRHRSMPRRLIAAVISMLMVATIVLTRSRGGALGLGVALVALMILGRKVRPGFAVIAIVTLMASAPLLPGSFWTRMSSIVDAEEDAKQFTGSRAARSAVMREGINTFLDRPLTGVGVGQFKNYNPQGREQPWLETHNAMIQVAAETGFAGLLLFLFLILRAGTAAVAARRMLDQRRADSPEGRALSPSDRDALYENIVGLSAGLAGWFTCALFASVAYNWTFYYLLALIVATRELVKERRRLVAISAEAPAGSSRFITSARVFPDGSTQLA